MDCDQVECEEIVEKYLTDKLNDAQQKDFEVHYFDCSRCRERLQVSRTLQAELWEQGETILAESSKKRSIEVWRWTWAPLAAAALIVFSIVLWRPWREAGQQTSISRKLSSSLSVLAEFEPPPYMAPTLRGATDEATERFQTGMRDYLEGRYGQAIPDLQAAARLNPKAANIRFFLGICFLLTGKTDAGSDELEKTIALEDSAYLEEAHFYLAKACLRKGNAGGARVELEKVIKSQGSLADEASRILSQLK